MFDIRVRNFDQFVDSLDRWVDATEQEVADIANGVTVEMFNRVLLTSPQFSGDYAGNWRYSVNHVDTSFEELSLLPSDPNKVYKVGSMPAILHAKAENRGKDHGYKLGDTFYLANSAQHEDSYAVLIETGRIKFRPGHEGETAGKAVLGVQAKYSRITPGQAVTLRRKKL